MRDSPCSESCMAWDLLAASTVPIPLEHIACILYIFSFSSVRKEGFFYQSGQCMKIIPPPSWLWMCWSNNNQSQLTGQPCHSLLLVMQSVVQRSRSNAAWFPWRCYCTWGTEMLYIMTGAQAAQRCSFCCVFINDYGNKVEAVWLHCQPEYFGLFSHFLTPIKATCRGGIIRLFFTPNELFSFCGD